MKIASPLTLNLTDTRAFKTWLYQIWQGVFFVAPHVHFSSLGSKTLKTGKGIFKSLCININGSPDSIIKIYDDTAATGTPIVVLAGDSGNGEYVYSKDFTIGLTIEVTGTTAPDCLVVFK